MLRTRALFLPEQRGCQRQQRHVRSQPELYRASEVRVDRETDGGVSSWEGEPGECDAESYNTEHICNVVA